MVSCSLGSLSNGGTATATITVTPAVQARLTNTVTVSNSATDSNLPNNTATVVSTVQGHDSLSVAPAISLTFSGAAGGSFNPGSQMYTLTNNGTAPFNWRATNTTTWVSVSLASGTLNAGTGTNITVSINANANGLSIGVYTNTITFTNLTSGVGSTNRTVVLNMVLPPSITNQPTSQVVTQGSNIVLSVGVAGTGPFRYQWLCNGTNLANNIITTIAGNGTAGFSGDGGAATNASLYSPYGVAVNAAGNLFIADTDNNRLRKVGTNGVITTVAGNGVATFSGDRGSATNASLSYPYSVAVDSAGQMFIADSYNNRIRKVGTNGIITTVAGNGTAAFTGDGGSATNASLDYPFGIAVDLFGESWIADTLNGRLRVVSSQGIIATAAGNGTATFAGDGGSATNASMDHPYGVAVDAYGDVFVVDDYNCRIRKVSPAGTITTVVGKGYSGTASGDGGAATNATLCWPTGVAVDAFGELFIADCSNNRVREVNSAGIITTVAGNGTSGYSGDGGVATNASLAYPWGVAADAAGNLFIADMSNSRIRFVPLAGSATLNLSNVTTNNAGSYSVIVSSPYGSVTSGVATVTVGSGPNPPALVVNPGSLSYGSIAVGQAGTLSFQVINTGGQALTGAAVGSSPFAVTPGSSYNVAGGQTSTVTVAFTPSGSGTFNASVIFTSNGGSSTNLVSGTGVTAPVAAFSGLPTYGAAPLSVTFTDNSTGTITNRHWDFGDGNTTDTALTSVLYVYSAAGTNTVSLTVSGPGGTSTLSQANYIIVTNTNLPPTTSQPSLVVLKPTDYQLVTNTLITVSGTAYDANGIGSVTINGASASVLGDNWSVAYILASGTNTITVIATDDSPNMNTATQVVRAVVSGLSTNHVPVIVSPPIVTNALLQLDAVAVVVQSETNTFWASATDPGGKALNYQWNFGDGSSSGSLSTNLATHSYTNNECRPYAASVTVSDGQGSVSSNLTVAVACQLHITRVQSKLEFARLNADRCTVKGWFEPPTADYTPANRRATLNIGGAEMSFNLGRKGYGHNGASSFRPSYDRGHTNWFFTARLRNGAWQTPWAEYGMINSNIPMPGILVTNLPVILILDNEAYAGTTNLSYTATRWEYGTGK